MPCLLATNPGSRRRPHHSALLCGNYDQPTCTSSIASRASVPSSLPRGSPGAHAPHTACARHAHADKMRHAPRGA
ncbi:hypothetical protein EVG20_g9615 [Dentipellis fragilis]|uniref:Uncharacterized protein n=1 Tax=Dentipellis fragilis TaxID=205917 RepID=A0A4Y9XX48_9AGAM|nr:hypothetical protein EVG20_g9615 [Dentipellis fragilis]